MLVVDFTGRVQVESTPRGRGPEFGLNPMPQSKDVPASDVVLRAFAPLHRTALGVACGVTVGAFIFLATIAAVIKKSAIASGLGLLDQFLFGYRVTVPGAFVGMLWGFGLGFLGGWGFAVLRNLLLTIWLISTRSDAEREQYSDFLDRI